MNTIKPQNISMNFHEVKTITAFTPGKQYLVCEEGVAWITFTDDPKDYIIKAGEKINFNNPGNILIESLSGELKLQIKDCA